MGIFDIFQSKTTPVQSSSTNNVPKWVDEASQRNYQLAEQITNRDYVPYSGSRIQPFSDDTYKAFDLTRSNTGGYKSGLGKAGISLDKGAAGFNSGDLSKYMNTFTKDALDPAISEIRRQAEISRKGIGDRAIATGGVGGDRQGVAEGELAGRELQIISQLIGDANFTAFGDAMAYSGQDRDRALAAAPQYAGLGDMESKLGLRDAAALQAVGGAQEGKGQESLDTRYMDFLRQLGYPEEMLNYRMGILGGSPYSTTNVTNGQALAPNAFAQTAGGVGSIAALLSMLR